MEGSSEHCHGKSLIVRPLVSKMKAQGGNLANGLAVGREEGL